MPFSCACPKFADVGNSCKYTLYGISSLMYTIPVAFSGVAPVAVTVAFSKVITA